MGIASMTGFGAGTATVGGEAIAVEVKSVNGKFCEVKPRLPRELSSLEADVTRLVKERLARGNVDVHVRRTPLASVTEPQVDAALLEAYATAARAAARQAGIDERLSIADLLGLDGVVSLQERGPDLQSAGEALRTALSAAVDALVATRLREGASLEADLRGRAAAVRALLGKLTVAVPASLDAYRERLAARIKELAPEVDVDPARLAQELVVFAERTDVAEELTRLATHFDELDRLLERPGPVGRQLDFLIQEINREVNTTGSKSQSADISRLVVELKTEVERLREQVQNVE